MPRPPWPSPRAAGRTRSAARGARRCRAGGCLRCPATTAPDSERLGAVVRRVGQGVIRLLTAADAAPCLRRAGHRAPRPRVSPTCGGSLSCNYSMDKIFGAPAPSPGRPAFVPPAAVVTTSTSRRGLHRHERVPDPWRPPRALAAIHHQPPSREVFVMRSACYPATAAERVSFRNLPDGVSGSHRATGSRHARAWCRDGLGGHTSRQSGLPPPPASRRTPAGPAAAPPAAARRPPWIPGGARATWVRACRAIARRGPKLCRPLMHRPPRPSPLARGGSRVSRQLVSERDARSCGWVGGSCS